MSKKLILIAFFMLGILISACKADSVSSPTTDPGQVETQVAEEVANQLTQIAISEPIATMTSEPAVPATDLPTPTNTLLPPTETIPTSEPAGTTSIPPTSTSTASALNPTKRPSPTPTPLPFACKSIEQSPENGKTFKPNADLDVVWTVKNVGTAIWDQNEVDYRYESGDEFYQNEVYDLPESVKPGESIDLIVDMKTPDEEGKYDTTWVLRRGSHLLCTLKVEINVKK